MVGSGRLTLVCDAYEARVWSERAEGGSAWIVDSGLQVSSCSQLRGRMSRRCCNSLKYLFTISFSALYKFF